MTDDEVAQLRRICETAVAIRARMREQAGVEVHEGGITPEIVLALLTRLAEMEADIANKASLLSDYERQMSDGDAKLAAAERRAEELLRLIEAKLVCRADCGHLWCGDARAVIATIKSPRQHGTKMSYDFAQRLRDAELIAHADPPLDFSPEHVRAVVRVLLAQAEASPERAAVTVQDIESILARELFGWNTGTSISADMAKCEERLSSAAIAVMQRLAGEETR